MKKIILIFYLLIETSAWAQEKREYSETEFRDAVKKAVEVELKRLGRNKIVDFSRELLDKEDELKVKELQLTKREEAIKISEQGFLKQIQEFQQKQENFLSCVDQVGREQDNRIQHMVESISNMRPQNAADILSVQDAEISVKILGLLEPDKIARIFNLMDKEVSARLQKQYMNMKK